MFVCRHRLPSGFCVFLLLSSFRFFHHVGPPQIFASVLGEAVPDDGDAEHACICLSETCVDFLF